MRAWRGRDAPGRPRRPRYDSTSNPAARISRWRALRTDASSSTTNTVPSGMQRLFAHATLSRVCGEGYWTNVPYGEQRWEQPFAAMRYHRPCSTGLEPAAMPGSQAADLTNSAQPAQRSTRTLLLLLAVGAAYYLGARLGFVLRFPPATTSVIWPPNALLTAALLLTPPAPLVAVLFAAVLPAHLLVEIQAGFSTGAARGALRHQLPGGRPRGGRVTALERRCRRASTRSSASWPSSRARCSWRPSSRPSRTRPPCTSSRESPSASSACGASSRTA